jgi:predicted nucleotide-binding protein
MSDMPARKPSGSEPPPWVQTALLTLPLPDARAQLEELISEGSGLAVEVSKAMDAEEFTGRVDEWRRRTSQWLNKNIGGQAAYDYKVAVESAKGHVWSRSLWDQYRVARKRDIEYEVRVLRSIERRLPDWVQPSAGSSAEVGQRPARVTPRAKKSGKAVMVVYGHDEEAKVALFKWLRMIGLQPKEWTQLVKESDSPISYVGQVVKRAFDSVQAVVVLFTPDEYVRPARVPPESDDLWRLQARPNVLIETGMALITHPDRLIFIYLGPEELELPSDLSGRHYVRLDGSPERLNEIATYLQRAGCPVDRDGSQWLNPNIFPSREHPGPSAARLTNRDPISSAKERQ